MKKQSFVYTAFTGNAQTYVRAYHKANAVAHLQRIASESKFAGVNHRTTTKAANQFAYSGCQPIDKP